MRSLARRISTPRALLAVMLVSFAVILGCAIAAGELLRLAERAGGSTAFDSSVTRWAVTHRSPGLTTLARFLSTVGSQTVLAPLAALVTVLLLVRRHLVRAGLLVVAWGGAILLYNLTKDIVERPRPPSYLWLTSVGRTSSFPSGHATQSLATFAALALVAVVSPPRWRWVLGLLVLILATGIGWSRVYLGVHWTTDVAAGWLIAAAWIALLGWLARPARSVEHRLANEKPGRRPDKDTE